MDFDIKDIKLASEGKRRIEWAERRMPVLAMLKKRFSREKPLNGIRIGACLHVTAETAVLAKVLKAGGAEVYLCASNPLSTQDNIAASLVADCKIPVFAIKGEDSKTYYKHLKNVLGAEPNITMDDGADLVASLHKNCMVKLLNGYMVSVKEDKQSKPWNFLGSSEETTTGVIRLRAMEKDNALKIPVLAVNGSYTKYLFDNRYGTGQSTIDGILRAANTLLAGKKFVVCGYGWCGRGLANRARGMGANVIVTEVEPLRALEAVMDGFRVLPILEAAKEGDIFVTATGDKNVITVKHMQGMKDGAILANSGHFNVEVELDKLEKIAVNKKQAREHVAEYKIPISNETIEQSNNRFKRIYILGEGRLINLVAAEGHPAEVMDLSFSNQALAAEYFVKNKGKLKAKVYKLPEKLDKMVAKLKLKAMGIKIDKLTREQGKYLQSWKEGT